MGDLRWMWTLLIAIVVLVGGGTLAFHHGEGRDILTSAYFTIITLTTVGYGDVTPATPEGKFVAAVMIVSGVVLFALLMGVVTHGIVGGQLRKHLGRRKLVKEIAALRNHYIVCGFGRIGAIVCRELHTSNVPFVVIERDQDACQKADEDGYLYLAGDATDDDDLVKAGIHQARGLIAVLPTDADNVFVSMSAHDLNKDLTIVARGEDERTEKKLARAGANRVVSPYEIGGLRMAHAILRPNVIDFIEAATRAKTGIDMEEVRIRARSPYAGQTLAESGIRQNFGLIIVAIRRPDGKMTFNPSHKTRIEADDVLITMGPEKNQRKLVDSCA